MGFEGFTGGMKASDIVIVSVSGEVKRVTPKEGSVNLGPKIYGGKIYFTSDYEYSGEREWVYTYSLKDGKVERVSFPHKDLESFEPVELSYDPEAGLGVAGKDGEARLSP